MTKSSFRQDAEAVASLREPKRRALYEYVARQPSAVSRDQAAEAVGLTRTLAGFHLDRLVAAGLLTAGYRRLSGRSGPGAGRPAKLYRRSRRRVAVSLPPRDHELLAAVLADVLSQDPADPKRTSPAREVGRSLGTRSRSRLPTDASPTRLSECVVAVLERLGFEPYRADNGEWLARNCPFDPLSRRFSPVVCGAGQDLVGGVIDGVGAEGVAVSRRERPDQCCVVLSHA